MIFLWPFMLWLLLLLPVLVAAYVLVLRRKKRSAVRFANLAMVKAAMGKSLSWRRHVPPALLLLALGVLIVSFAMSSTPWLSYVLIFAAGIASMSLFSISFSIVQLAVPEELRGRVVSIYMVSLRGGWPLGSLVAGTLATMFPAPHVVALNGLLLSLFTVGVLISGRAKSLRELSILRDARAAICHCRWVTNGSALHNINNHPHPSDGGWIVHNGTIHNHRFLVSSHGLAPSSECDSEVAGLLIEELTGTIRDRVRKTVNLCDGPLALVGLWPRPQRMVIARDSICSSL